MYYNICIIVIVNRIILITITLNNYHYYIE